jgi:Tfp pilus assembly protein PilF
LKGHVQQQPTGLASYKTRHQLALLYLEQGQAGLAENQWRLALAERPDFQPARLGLADLALKQGQWDRLEQIIAELVQEPQGRVEAAVLRARRHLAEREFGAARQLLEAVIAEAPQALWPHVILSHVLLQEGRDDKAAEQALRAVVALDREHAEARSNLALLLAQRGRQN